MSANRKMLAGLLAMVLVVLVVLTTSGSNKSLKSATTEQQQQPQQQPQPQPAQQQQQQQQPPTYTQQRVPLPYPAPQKPAVPFQPPPQAPQAPVTPEKPAVQQTGAQAAQGGGSTGTGSRPAELPSAAYCKHLAPLEWATAAQLDKFKTQKHAQSGEDGHVLDVYPTFARQGGIFLESGALDGARFSTSWAFAKALNWKAYHIEASPSNFAGLKQNRPEATNIHAALCAQQGDVHWVEEKDGAIAGIWEFMTPTFRKGWYKKEDHLAKVPKYGTTIQCKPLSQILKEHNVTYVDIWVLDVEGAEIDVLHTVDFSAVSFGLIIKEAAATNLVKEVAADTILESHGYRRVQTWGESAWYVNECVAWADVIGPK